VPQHKVVVDAELAQRLSSLKRQARSPTARLLAFAGHAVSAAQVNDYLAPFGVTAKQFRTYHATRLARAYLLAHPATSREEKEAVEKAMFDAVSHELGHTAAVCRQSYIDPRVIAAYESGALK
jgi:DNA topoisomerase IB